MEGIRGLKNISARKILTILMTSERCCSLIKTLSMQPFRAFKLQMIQSDILLSGMMAMVRIL
jgi:hypothetical protein